MLTDAEIDAIVDQQWGRGLSPAAQALYEAEGAARFTEHHPAARVQRACITEYEVEAELAAILARRRKANASGQNGEDAELIRAALRTRGMKEEGNG